jgi:multiple sugar transport system permease protein
VPAARASIFRLTVRRREALHGILFFLPWLIGLLCFVAGPMVASLGLSFTKYDMVREPQLIGLQNYREIFTADKLFWPSLGRTFLYAAVVVPAGLAGSLLAALLLNQRLRGTSLFRTFYFLPSLMPVVASTILWTWLFNVDWGPINHAIRTVGLPPPGWYRSAEWAMPMLIVIALWGAIGGNSMLIFLAGLQGVPQDLYEAAAIDGAGPLARARHVTIPMLTPTIFLNLVLGVIAALRVFASAFLATAGGPAYATWFYALHIYNKAFVYFEMGYASALSWIFFFVVLALTYVQFRASARWVYYAGAGK